MKRPLLALAIGALGISCFPSSMPRAHGAELGREVSIPRHLQDGEEFTTPLKRLIEHGQLLFNANWTTQEGGGRPLAKGTGPAGPLADLSEPLVFPRNFNRVSGPDANSCAGCHNFPISGGKGDIVANVFVLANRFDFAMMDRQESIPTKGNVDEKGHPKQWPPARFQHIARGPNQKVSLVWAGNSGLYSPPRLFQLQKATDLHAPNWSNVGKPTAGNRAEIEADGLQGFFRLQPVERK